MFDLTTCRRGSCSGRCRGSCGDNRSDNNSRDLMVSEGLGFGDAATHEPSTTLTGYPSLGTRPSHMGTRVWYRDYGYLCRVQ